LVEVAAQMVGSVVALVAAAGQQVAAGDALLIVESMKMEIPILAPVTGTVAEIRVAAADVVEEGDVLALIDAQ
jgi:biotin carboxyl carrier protein